MTFQQKCLKPTKNIFISTFSPTKASKLDVLTNVKSQIEGIGGWLGSSIPKLRKGETDADSVDDHPPFAEGDTPASAESVKGFVPQKDDDDNSRYKLCIRFLFLYKRMIVPWNLVLPVERIQGHSLTLRHRLMKKKDSLAMVNILSSNYTEN